MKFSELAPRERHNFIYFLLFFFLLLLHYVGLLPVFPGMAGGRKPFN